jgi:hypothetical protein
VNTVAEPSRGAQADQVSGARYSTLRGGLGNQIFQYLFARRLAALGVRIDSFVPRFAGDTYGRSILVERVAREPLRLLPEGLPDGVGLIGGEDLDAIVETLSRHPDAPVLLTGYWQRIEYVDALDVSALVETPDHVNALCAVHLRRVDYGHHGHLPLRYYSDALASLGVHRASYVPSRTAPDGSVVVEADALVDAVAAEVAAAAVEGGGGLNV